MLLPACFGRDDGAVTCVLQSLTDARWHALIEQALLHGVAPLLWVRLTKLNVTAPPRILERLQDSYLHNALRNTTVLDELSHVFASLRRDEIPVIALKGAHLANAVYHDPAVRPMADVDLLVPPAKLAQAEHVLLELGYGRITGAEGGRDYATHHHMHVLFKTAAIPIELHRSIVPSQAPFCIDLDGLWSRTRNACIAGIDIRVLAPEDLIYHLCLHAAHNHRFDIPLLYLCDIAAAIECHRDEIDWKRFVAVANADGTSRFVYCSLMLVQSVLGAEFPPLAPNGLRHEQTDQAICDAARDCILNAGVDSPAVYQELAQQPRFRSKARLLLQSVYPSPARMREIYDLPLRSTMVYWYYLVRPVDLLRKRGKVTAQMLLRSSAVRPTLDRMDKRRMIDRWVDGGVPSGALPSDRSRAEKGWTES